MDHFEQIVKLLLEREGYWTLSSFKVNLSKEEKAATGKHTIPRPEIDLVAYRPGDREIIAVEVKSFLDSTGVSASDLMEEFDVAEGRYKLFTSKKYREVVFNRLVCDLIEKKFVTDRLPVRLGLAVGKIKRGDQDKLNELASDNRWVFWSPDKIKESIIDLSKAGYENEAVIITSKILLR